MYPTFDVTHILNADRLKISELTKFMQYSTDTVMHDLIIDVIINLQDSNRRCPSANCNENCIDSITALREYILDCAN